jgi:long-chain acyl-CoA synthetase
MSACDRIIFLTGATGLVGSGVLARMLSDNPSLRAYVLVRDRTRWNAAASRLRIPTERVTVLLGDVREPGLGLDASTRAQLAREITAVLHLAADIVFSRPLEPARATNVEGTRHLLDVSEAWSRMERFAFASTAFVAGCRTGLILESDDRCEAGWANAYEQSKWEAEQLVRASGRDAVIFRSSTIVCDSMDGEVSQYNAVHRALRLYHNGLAPMMPGSESSPVDLVPADFVCDAIARLALCGEMAGQTLHLCAGAGAIPLGELLDVTYEIWARSSEWKRRGILRPALADLATYRLFEESVEETADARLRQVMRSLSYFVPQLALPKRFDTTHADAALGTPAPPVRSYWARVIEHLLTTRWAASLRRAA